MQGNHLFVTDVSGNYRELPQLPPEAHQKMVRLMARMLNEHLQKDSRASAQAEVGDE